MRASAPTGSKHSPKLTNSRETLTKVCTAAGAYLKAATTVPPRWPDLPVAPVYCQNLINSGSLLTLACVVLVS
jgi:hypothetical protein